MAYVDQAPDGFRQANVYETRPSVEPGAQDSTTLLAEPCALRVTSFEPVIPGGAVVVVAGGAVVVVVGGAVVVVGGTKSSS